MSIPSARAALLLSLALLLAAAPAFGDDAGKTATSAKLLIRNKDYAGAKAVLSEALKATPDAPELVLLAATCDENLGETGAALKGYRRCVELLDADPAAAPAPVRQQAAAGIKRLDETDKLVAKYSAMLEDEARRQRRINERAYDVLTRAAQVLKGDGGETAGGVTGDNGATARGASRASKERLRTTPSEAPKATVIAMAQFRSKYADALPSESNLARGGRAEASSSHPDRDQPITALGGARKVDTWCLHGGTGWFLAEWAAPIGGRYVLIFTRPGGADHWETASIDVNGRELAKIGPTPTSSVVLIDLGEPVAIKTVRVSIKGIENPGIAGLEVHRGGSR